eukprot:scaffold101527_cov63-Phaeocystis_antarctica.AAC.2
MTHAQLGSRVHLHRRAHRQRVEGEHHDCVVVQLGAAREEGGDGVADEVAHQPLAVAYLTHHEACEAVGGEATQRGTNDLLIGREEGDVVSCEGEVPPVIRVYLEVIVRRAREDEVTLCG